MFFAYFCRDGPYQIAHQMDGRICPLSAGHNEIKAAVSLDTICPNQLKEKKGNSGLTWNLEGLPVKSGKALKGGKKAAESLTMFWENLF